ncbi:Lsr2 family DNA-binding protein [Streptomyces hundungensis]|uniref:Lsr2 family DNA-binding protein n=1 Tax=Streptomyces hundungensis TaxID=1077946 RepID=UPI0033DE67D3
MASDALLKAFGMDGPLHTAENDSRPTEAISLPSDAPEQTEREADTDADLKDYCTRITDTRKATKGRKLIYGTQSARAQFERHRSRIGVITGNERTHYEEWCRHTGVDVNATASHVEFRGFLWVEFPDLARKYVDAMKGHSGDPDTSDRAENRLIREWARDHGYDVSKRGRLSMEVRHAYRLAHRESADKESHAA